MVALPGDPTAAQQALVAVMATSIANGGSAANVAKGIDFFKKLKANGNFVAVKGNASNFATGSFKISLGWDYNAIGYTAAAQKIGKTIKYVYPSDAHVQGTPYVLAINKTAPHPAAARLWEEFMFSQVKGKISKDLGANDYKKIKGAKMMAQIMGGQNSYIIGGAHPTTEPAMQAKGLAVASPAGIPVPANWPKMVVPSVDYQNAASEVLKAAWPNL
jgi:putative spermidine/putrescine transport system substrate-binding protein